MSVSGRCPPISRNPILPNSISPNPVLPTLVAKVRDMVKVYGFMLGIGSALGLELWLRFRIRQNGTIFERNGRMQNAVWKCFIL